jgi:hypothetical protein
MTVQEYAAILLIPFGAAVNPAPIAQVAAGTQTVPAASIVRVH